MRAAGGRGLAIDVVDQNQSARGGCEPEDEAGLAHGVAGTDQLKCSADQLQPYDCGDRGIDKLEPMLALLACRREAVEQADPDEVTGTFREAKE